MKRFFRLLLHYTTYLLGGLLILLSAIALVLRFAIMPDIARYKASIEASASRAVGVPVEISAITADWWRINPRFSLHRVYLKPSGQPAPLRLEEVDATLSWLSLALLEPHMVSLDIIHPTLEIRRDKAGVIHVAGIPVNLPGAPSPFPDWLLRQRTVSISGGRVIWLDEALNAPPLTLDRVNLRLISHFSRHRFGLTAVPPAGAGRFFDLRGDLSGQSIERPQDWGGQLYARADGASASALHAWAPWAQQAVKRSTGNLRFWLTIEQGRPQALSGDVSLADVAISLDPALPDMAFRQVQGRLGWQRGKTDHTFFVEKLRFTTADGFSAEPATARAVVKPNAAGKVVEADLTIDRLRLETLTALSGALPLPRLWHDWLATFNPRGYIEHAQISWLGKTRFQVKSRFRQVGFNPSVRLPGASGLTGMIEADENQGRLSLDSTQLRFQFDRVFRHPLDFDRAQAELTWRPLAGNGYRFELSRGLLANADLDGQAEGSLTWRSGAAPVLDLQARLTRGNGTAVWRYLPHQVSDNAYAWLKASLQGGVSPDTRLVLRGPMDRFPFDQGGGDFQVDVAMRDAVLAYAPDWPRITGIEGVLTFKGKAMTIAVERGECLGTRLGPVRAVLPDLHSAVPEILTVDGHANGPGSAFLGFIRQSPVHDYTARFTETMRTEGDGDLQLRLVLPLRHIEEGQVAGRFHLAGNRVALGPGYPDLEQVSGNLEFTESWLKGSDISARLYGQPVSLSLASENGGRLRANLRGTLAATTLANWLPAALAPRLTGRAAFQAEVGLRQHQPSLKVNSDLTGLAIDLPAPLGKKAEQPVTTQVSLREAGGGTQVSLQYGGLLSAALLRDDKGKDRVAIQLGGMAAPLPKANGVVVRGNLRHLDLDAWRRSDLMAARAGKITPDLIDLNLTFNTLQVMDRRLNDINVQATPLNPGWRVKLAGREVQGSLDYAPNPNLPGQRLVGRFDKLVIPRPMTTAPARSVADSAAEWPGEVQIAAKSLAVRDQEIGGLDLRLTQERAGLRVNRLSLDNQFGRLEGGGWLSLSPLRTSEINLRLDTDNLGKLMRRLGYPEGVRGGELAVFGQLNWTGTGDDLSLDKLNGKLKLTLKQGRFTQLDPGAGRLLAILSLQALPRHIALDFRDVFSEGFTFDEIHGDVHIDHGIGYLPDLRINGPAAKVRMNGKIDLVHEDQTLRLRVEPRLDEGVALAGAILGGPAVGVGALVASKILRDPIAKAAGYEYLVSGTWDTPTVRKLARPVAETAAPAP